MRNGTFATTCLAVTLTMVVASPARAQFYAQHNLVSDGTIPADHTDPDLVNAWGLVASATSPWWVSDNGTGVSTLYNGNTGAKIPINATGHVAIPGGVPTGIVFNFTTGFHIPNDGTARFIFSSEAGIISAWPGQPALSAVVVADNSASGAVYKGLAIAQTTAGPFLYATNFHAGTVDVFDGSFSQVTTTGFRDPTLPAGYAPFGIQIIGGVVYVTYALQDATAHDDVAGEGHGFVNAFDVAGNLLMRVASRDELNSPWGIAMAPAGFGKFSGDLLIGNFGDGRIHAFIPPTTPGGSFESHGPLHSTQGPPIEIDGLWALQFGNGAAAGPTTTLFFTAGPVDESHGLFGTLVVAASPGHGR